MKNVNLLILLFQLGICVAVPLAAVILLAIWLQNRFSLGSWIVIVGVVLGIFSAAQGLIVTLRAMQRLSKDKKAEKPPLAFNEHE